MLSRSWLGFRAVATVLLAIMASFGLLFAIGVPFTALTPVSYRKQLRLMKVCDSVTGHPMSFFFPQLLPFIIFGVGLDDAFIISGAYSRTDHSKNPVDWIHDTMVDIGGTILLTTLTLSLAFALGLVSSIPAVRFVVMYAFPP